MSVPYVLTTVILLQFLPYSVEYELKILLTSRQAGTHANTQAGRKTGRHSGTGQAGRQLSGQMRCGEVVRLSNRQTAQRAASDVVRWLEFQTGRLTYNRWLDFQTGRQTHKAANLQNLTGLCVPSLRVQTGTKT